MKIITCRINRLPIVPTCNIQKRTVFDWLKNKKDEEKETSLDEDFKAPIEQYEVEPRWARLSEEQILEIRDKSRLPRDVKCEIQGIPHLGTRLPHLDHYRREHIRQYWATYGEASGLKPGVCWPNKSELEFKMKFEKTFYPSFDEMVERKRMEKEAKEKELNEYRADVMKKLKDLPKIKREFMNKYNEKLQEEKQELIKREKLIQEVREYLGYDVSPSDTRFQEALLKMEENKKVVAKASKKQEKQAKILAQLAAMASEDIKKAEEARDTTEKTSETEPQKKE